MPTIVTIGYRRFLLKDSANINQLINCFEGAIPVEYDHQNGMKTFTPDNDRDVGLTVEIVTKKQILPAKSRMAIPEVASPDCHGKNITKRD